MRSLYRTVSDRLPETITRSQRRDCLVIALTIAAVGVSYGALSAAAGFPVWQTVLIAALTVGGAAELTFVGVVAAGGAPILGVLGGLLVNSRNFAFGLSIGEYAPRGWRRFLAAHAANDETAAFSRSVRGKKARWDNFVLMAVALPPAWVGGAVVGQVLGTVIDANMLGVDAAFPVILFCLVARDLKNPLMSITAALGAFLTVVATPALPLGLGSVVSLLALLPAAGFQATRYALRDRRRARRASRVLHPATRPSPTVETLPPGEGLDASEGSRGRPGVGDAGEDRMLHAHTGGIEL